MPLYRRRNNVLAEWLAARTETKEPVAVEDPDAIGKLPEHVEQASDSGALGGEVLWHDLSIRTIGWNRRMVSSPQSALAALRIELDDVEPLEALGSHETVERLELHDLGPGCADLRAGDPVADRVVPSCPKPARVSCVIPAWS